MSTSISTPVRNPTHADGRCKTFDRTSKRLKNFCQDIPTGSLREQSPYCETVTSDDEIDVELNFGVDGEFDSSHCDDDFDTDLEGEEDKHIYDASGRATYISACNECGVVPASYYLRHMKDSSLEMHHHGVGVKGARAMAIALVTNTFVLNLNLSDNGLGQEGVHHICNMLKENCYITDLETKQAPSNFWTLNGQAREASLCLDITSLAHDDGVKSLLDCLDKLFLKDETCSTCEAYEAIEKYVC